MDEQRFGRYRLEELIGRGGMGEVYRAYDTVRGRVVALKRLPRGLASDPEVQARFRKESELAARLSDPHIIPIHDYGEIDGMLFLEMPLVDGADLGALVASGGPLPVQRVVRIVTLVARALDTAHGAGLVHRDVKPSNVLVSTRHGEDYAYLVDFGIAHFVAGTRLTATGVAVGTAEYMAPERFLVGEDETDQRVDVYALGCVLFEALTGRPPFPARGPAAQMYAHVHVPPPRPSDTRPDVGEELDAVVARAMAKRPEERYPSAGELAAAARVACATAPDRVSEGAGSHGPRAAAPVTVTPRRRPAGKSSARPEAALRHGAAVRAVPASSARAGRSRWGALPVPDRVDLVALGAPAVAVVLSAVLDVRFNQNVSATLAWTRLSGLGGVLLRLAVRPASLIGVAAAGVACGYAGTLLSSPSREIVPFLEPLVLLLAVTVLAATSMRWSPVRAAPFTERADRVLAGILLLLLFVGLAQHTLAGRSERPWVIVTVVFVATAITFRASLRPSLHRLRGMLLAGGVAVALVDAILALTIVADAS